MSITREQVLQAIQGENLDDNEREPVIDDILRIVNDGYRYEDRSEKSECNETAAYRIPEDISTGLVLKHFGIDAYKKDDLLIQAQKIMKEQREIIRKLKEEIEILRDRSLGSRLF
jgi:hypothetical protein